MRIGITYDLKSDHRAMGKSEEDCAEFDQDITITAIADALAALGHQPVRIGHIRALAERLVAGERWDAVFNIAEGVAGPAREAQVPCLLDAYGIPYVFSDALTLAVCLDKGWAKRIAQSAGVPTPPFAVIEKASDLAGLSLPYPLFAKPVAEGSGKGVSARSHLAAEADVKAVVPELLARFRQPVLIETYLPGREFTVGITGSGDAARVLGVMEILPNVEAGTTDYGFESKVHWMERVRYRLAEDAAGEAAGEVALKAWRALRCRDAGRIDIRNDASGAAQFIEVNPLAGLNPEESDLCFIARFKGLSYRDLIGRILVSFLARHPELEAMALGACAG